MRGACDLSEKCPCRALCWLWGNASPAWSSCVSNGVCLFGIVCSSHVHLIHLFLLCERNSSKCLNAIHVCCYVNDAGALVLSWSWQKKWAIFFFTTSNGKKCLPWGWDFISGSSCVFVARMGRRRLFLQQEWTQQGYNYGFISFLSQENSLISYFSPLRSPIFIRAHNDPTGQIRLKGQVRFFCVSRILAALCHHYYAVTPPVTERFCLWKLSKVSGNSLPFFSRRDPGGLYA